MTSLVQPDPEDGRTGSMRVVMVCLGNICRSPMAAMVGQAMVDDAGLGDRVTVESFGTAGYHVAGRADPGGGGRPAAGGMAQQRAPGPADPRRRHRRRRHRPLR
ncbi:MAG: hypothetical protein M3Y91_15615 [Actinomycetota bacterium]|nr:hypothetical protein [Actinomycetota bacterium]